MTKLITDAFLEKAMGNLSCPWEDPGDVIGRKQETPEIALLRIVIREKALEYHRDMDTLRVIFWSHLISTAPVKEMATVQQGTGPTHTH